MQGVILNSVAHSLLRLKAALLAVSLSPAGILILMINSWLSDLHLGPCRLICLSRPLVGDPILALTMVASLKQDSAIHHNHFAI